MDNIILIGMPGCGKSSIGVVLAKVLAYDFIDSDILIQEKEGKKLSEIVDTLGPWGFNKIEDEINASIEVTKTVIATGGSAVHGEKAMIHFRKAGVVIYLKLPYEEIEKRLGVDFRNRGISIEDNKTIKELYDERVPLYEKYAHLTVETEGLSIRETVNLLEKKLNEFG